ncbi:MAG: ATP-binding protein [Thermoproteota archaeon]|nr:ATP-binding protein [Thermoproteota archaeon]
MNTNKIKLSFAPGLEIEFVDRERALKQVEELAEKGTRFPIVVFGPEGCGKTALLKQATFILRELGFEAIYIDPLHRDFIANTDIREAIKKLAEATAEVIGVAQVKLATLALDIFKDLISRWRKKYVAILIDEVFQAIGLDKAEIYVKSLLNLIEYPPASYEAVVSILATSEGVTRGKIGRHLWALLKPMWNMSKSSFEELYEKIPGQKPSFENIWKITGGNPRILAQLYEFKWDIELVIRNLIESKKLDTFISSLSDDEKKWLSEAIIDPDSLLTRDRIPLLNKLVELNLIIDAVPERDQRIWIDVPPLERDLELGIGKHVAWQIPLYKESIKKVLM